MPLAPCQAALIISKPVKHTSLKGDAEFALKRPNRASEGVGRSRPRDASAACRCFSWPAAAMPLIAAHQHVVPEHIADVDDDGARYFDARGLSRGCRRSVPWRHGGGHGRAQRPWTHRTSACVVPVACVRRVTIAKRMVWSVAYVVRSGALLPRNG